MMDRDVEIAMDELKKFKRTSVLGYESKSQFLRIKQVLELVPFSRGTLYRMMEAGTFPMSKNLGLRILVWSKDEVNAWIKARLDA